MLNLKQALEGSHILVIGGAGFVGSNLVRYVLHSADNVKVTVIDNLLSSERENLPDDERLQFIEGSITDPQILHQLQDEYHYLFHLATYHGNQSSIHNPLEDHENNTLTTLKLFDRFKHSKEIKKVVYSSAGCSVAEKTFENATASKEVDLVSLDMDSPYSISKIIGEFYSKYYFKQHHLPIVRARFQNVYGPGEVLGAGRWRGTPATIWRNVVPTFIYKALKGEALPLENQGMTTRDFIFVEDIVRGLIHCALFGQAGEVFNLASGQETTIHQLAQTINQMTGNEAPLEFLPKRAWDNSGKRFGCTEKSKKEIAFAAQVDFTEGLKETIQWTEEHLSRIERTMDKHKQHMVI